jgi:ABC-type nitrate/sulfonate/bicarbonate transport system ATPase subunit
VSGWQPPTPEAIQAFLQRHGINKSEAARIAGLSGGKTIRRYTGGSAPHRISYAVLFTWAAHVVLTPEQFAAVDAAIRDEFENN